MVKRNKLQSCCSDVKFIIYECYIIGSFVAFFLRCAHPFLANSACTCTRNIRSKGRQMKRNARITIISRVLVLSLASIIITKSHFLARASLETDEKMHCEIDGACTQIRYTQEINGGQDLCQDKDESCSFWASHGECDINPIFMQQSCPRSCKICPPLQADAVLDEEGCEDLHELCGDWAESRECLLNSAYMSTACKDSCYLCVDTEKMRSRGDTEDLINRKKRYIQMNRGSVTQILTGNVKSEDAKFKSQIREMEKYAKFYMTGPEIDQQSRLGCKNHLDLCAQYAFKGMCKDDVSFMLNSCPLACMFCHNIEQFHQCSGMRPPATSAAFVGDESSSMEANKSGRRINDLFEDMKMHGKWTEYGIEFVTMPSNLSEGENAHDTNPWIVKFNNFLSSEECDHLLNLADSIGWEKSKTPNTELFSGNRNNNIPRRSSKSAYCKNKRGECANDRTYRVILERLSKITEVPTLNFEDVEFVQYSYGDSFGVHHDYQIHDDWKPAGQRIFSVFLCLSDVEEGGATGFPSLDWLFINSKKGQMILWPNVLSSDPYKVDNRMLNEALPVVKGKKIGAHLWLHMFDWHDALEKKCV